MRRLLSRPRQYSEYDADDLLLGHFEDLASLVSDGTINSQMAYDMFGYYVERSWENCEIQRYVRASQREDAEAYTGFERLYGEFHRVSHRKGQ
jgi:hypothetical protein